MEVSSLIPPPEECVGGFGSVRQVIFDNQYWFVGNDVCAPLGYANSQYALGLLPISDKRHIKISTKRGERITTVISLEAVVDLLFRGKTPFAMSFQSWVKREMVTSVLRTGSYTRTNKALGKRDPFFLPGARGIHLSSDGFEPWAVEKPLEILEWEAELQACAKIGDIEPEIIRPIVYRSRLRDMPEGFFQ